MPVTSTQLFSKGIDLLMDQKLEDSLVEFKKSQHHRWVIECYIRMNRNSDLISYFENVIKKSDDFSNYPISLYISVAKAYFDELQFSETKKILLKSLDIKKTAEAYNLLAKVFIEESKPKNALRAIKNSKILMKESEGNSSFHNVVELMGDYNHLLGDYKEAIKQYERSEELKVEMARLSDYLEQHIVLDDEDFMTVFRPFGPVAETSVNSLKKALEDAGQDHSKRSSILNRLGNYFSMKGDYDLATSYFNEALEFTKDEKLESFILNNQAIIDVKKGDYSKASQKIKKSYVKLKENKGNQIEIAYSLNNRAKIDELSGKIKVAEKTYILSLKTLNEYGDAKGRTVVLLNLANLARLRGQVEQGLEYYFRAFEGFKGKNSLRALLLLSIAEIFWVTGSLDIAMKRSKQAENLYNSLKIKDFHYCYNELLQSGIMSDKGSMVEAKEIIAIVEHLNDQIKSKALESIILLRKGILEQKQRNFGNAQDYFEAVSWTQFLPFIESQFRSAEIKSVEYLAQMDESFFDETLTLINTVLTHAKDNNFYHLMSESYILLSSLETARFNHEEAIKLSEMALSIADSYNLPEQNRKASLRLEKIKRSDHKPPVDGLTKETDLQDFQEYLEDAMKLVKSKSFKNK